MRLFKRDLQTPVEAIIQEIVPRLIKASVCKGQIEILDILITKAAIDRSPELLYLQGIRKNLVQELLNLSTTEEGEDSENCKSQTESEEGTK